MILSENMYEPFTWKNTPQKIKRYFIDLLGQNEARKLMGAMKRYDWIIIDGPHGPTGKTTLLNILRAIGYTRVIEANFATTIRATDFF